MTKTELAKQVAAAGGLTGEQAKSAVDAVSETIAGKRRMRHGSSVSG